jgi:ribosomal protein S18 acetylase RimI-like enzyme
MIRVESKKPNEEVYNVLARIASSVRKGTPLDSRKSTKDIIADIEKISAKDEYQILTAWDKEGTIRGWIYYYLGIALMAFINGFQPLVEPTYQPDQIALPLIEAAKRDIAGRGYSRLEIELNLPTDAHRILSKRYIEWYERAGFRFAAEEVHMSSDLISQDLPELSLPKPYVLRRFSDVSYEQLESAGFQTFENSDDALFRSMKPAEQRMNLKYFFDTSTPYVEDASVILELDGKIIGFVITRMRGGEAELGPVDLIPEVRGQGLASYLLTYVLRALKSTGTKTAVLDMSITNHPARKLYEKYGFKDDYYKQFYFWSSHATL